VTPEELRADIPVISDGTAYLNTGASGPSPQRVLDATADALGAHDGAHAGEGPYVHASRVYDDTRERVAAFVGADPTEVALTTSTTDGINRVAGAIDWTAGDTVVRTDLEHSAGILPWQRLADLRGVEIRVVPTEGGRIDREAYAEAVAGARLVCLSALTWTHGTVLPVADLVEVAHDAGAAVLVDAVQVPGQRPLDVSAWGAEFVAAAGHKWLLGPWGGGFLYVDADAVGGLEPAAAGYRSVTDPAAEHPTLYPDARRLEVGTTSPAPYVGLQAAIDTVEAVGLPAIQERIEALTDRLKAGLGDRLVGPRGYESGLVAFEVGDPEAFVERAADRGVVVRSLPTGTVRASVHAFNTREDVDALLSVPE